MIQSKTYNTRSYVFNQGDLTLLLFMFRIRNYIKKNRWSQQTRQSSANATPQPVTISISVRQERFFF